MTAVNTVQGMPEKNFRSMWVAMLWQAMLKTGKGYKRSSQRHTGKDGDRRADKKEMFGRTKLERRLRQMYA
jgi:hypothetical protein